jgi:hypothetical protein
MERVREKIAGSSAHTDASLSAERADEDVRLLGDGLRQECLRHIIPLVERHLRSAIGEFVDHYHTERHHQGLGNVIPFPYRLARSLNGRLCRRERLGGLLNFYERKAA